MGRGGGTVGAGLVEDAEVVRARGWPMTTRRPVHIEMMNAADAARMLAITQKQFTAMVERGDAPEGVMLGNQRRWSESDLRCWIRAGCPTAAAWATRKILHGRKGGTR